MTLSLSEKEKKSLVTIINDRIDEYLSRFPYFRYPVEPLESGSGFLLTQKQFRSKHSSKRSAGSSAAGSAKTSRTPTELRSSTL